MSNAALDSFMQLKSIDPNFIDASGQPAIVADQNIKRIVKLLGFDADDENALLVHYQEEETRHWLSLLAPVSIFQQSDSYELEVHLPIDFVTDQLLYRITTESGLQIDELLTATDFPLMAVNEISDVEFQLYNVTLPVQLEFGYHHLALLEVGNEEPLAVMALIVTPDICYQNKQIQKGKKVASTNISLPFFGADVTALKAPITQTAKEAAQLVHLNIDNQQQALVKQWAQLYHLDLSEIAEFKECKAAQEQLKALNELADNNAIEIIKVKLTALRHLFSHFNAQRQTNAADEFSTFIADGGIKLKQQASFDALHYKFLSENEFVDYSMDYSVWPSAFQSYASQGTQDWISENAQEILFWDYCHWVSDKQLTTLDEFAHSQGVTLGFYKKVVIGAANNSLQMWAEDTIYCQNLKIETPLDCPTNDVTTLNQSVEYSPLIPDQLYKSGYHAFIALLQSSMKHTGVLHIEHIASLLRLWWVPKGENQEQGAFVYYNVYDMLNLLALESFRHQCVVVCDDLESLPDGMNELLQEMGVYPLSLFDFR